MCFLPGPAQLGTSGKAPRHFVSSSRTISDTCQGMECELLLVTHLNKISDSDVRANGDFWSSIFTVAVLQCSVKRESKRMQFGRILLMEWNPIAPKTEGISAWGSVRLSGLGFFIPWVSVNAFVCAHIYIFYIYLYNICLDVYKMRE